MRLPRLWRQRTAHCGEIRRDGSPGLTDRIELDPMGSGPGGKPAPSLFGYRLFLGAAFEVLAVFLVGVIAICATSVPLLGLGYCIVRFGPFRGRDARVSKTGSETHGPAPR